AITNKTCVASISILIFHGNPHIAGYWVGWIELYLACVVIDYVIFIFAPLQKQTIHINPFASRNYQYIKFAVGADQFIWALISVLPNTFTFCKHPTNHSSR